MNKTEFLKKALQRISDAREHCHKWHKCARDDFNFIAGDQWEPEDEELLSEQNRPTVVFNYSEKMIDAVAGAEVSSRQEAVFKPRGIEDANLAELWTNAARWVRDECLAEDEETDAFRDALICGMGWVETSMDYSENKDGMPVMGRIDPIEMFWDPASIKPSLADRRYDIHAMWMDNDLVNKKWPRKLDGGVYEDMGSGQTWHIRTGDRYDPTANEDGEVEEDRRVDQTRIWNYQCVELEAYYRVADTSGQIHELESADFSALRDQIDAAGFQYVKEYKKVYYRGFIADDTVLEWGLSPCQHGFTRNCITGKRDRNRNMWYGLTRVMKDPQRWANKWLAQIMHIINSNAKGGLLAETGAFVDPRKAQDDWSSPDSVILLNEGGIAKIKEKTMSAYPSGLAQLMEFALNSLPQVTGINLEALGLANRDQANVLEQSRKQAAYGLLAPIFDSLRRYRKMQGKVLLYFITEYISDGRLIRIVGPGYEQYIALTKQPDAVTFDIIVDQSPSAPDVKQRTWDTLMQILPQMIKQGIPVPPDLLTYAPLPSGLIQSWQKFINEKMGQQGPSPEQMQQMQQEMQKLQEENQKIKQDKSEKIMEAQMKQKEMDFEMQMQVRQQEFDEKLELMKLSGDMRLQDMKAENDAKLAEKKVTSDMDLSRKNSEGKLKIQAASAGLNPSEKGEVKVGIDTTEIAGALKEITNEFSGALKEVVSAINQPKKVIRDAKGNVTGVAPVGKVK